MNLLQNKHLTLSAITHIHLESKKEGYFKQIESLISQSYFLHQSMKKQTHVNEEIDTEEMLKQSL